MSQVEDWWDEELEEPEFKLERLPTEEQKPYWVRCINFAEQVFWETGLLPTPDKLVEELGIKRDIVLEVMRSEKYKTALAGRGIDFDPYLSGKVLTPAQILCANVMLNTYDRRSDREKLEDIGVSVQQYNAWKRTPQFVNYITKRAEAAYKGADADAYHSLIRNVKAGDNKALDLFFQMRGIHTPRLNLDVNIEAVMLRVVEVISKHVTDPEVLVAVADELENVMPRQLNQKNP